MKVLTVLAHERSQDSFCGAITQAACETLRSNGHEVILKDLYAEHFNPVLTHEEITATNEQIPHSLMADIQQVLDADAYIIIHPNWWGMPPAILKGWVDRAIRQGFCYAFTEKGPIKKLSGRKGLVFTTGNTPPEVEINVNRDPLENLWINIIFGAVGIEGMRRNFASVIMSTPEQRTSWLSEVRNLVNQWK